MKFIPHSYQQYAIDFVERNPTLRDTLLPKLMNGEIDVSNINI